MKKTFLFAFSALVIFNYCFSQKTISLEQIFTDRNVYPKQVSSLKQHIDENYFTYINDYDELVKIDAKGVEKTIIGLAELNSILSKIGIEKIKRFPDYEWVGKNQITIVSKNKWIELNISEKTAKIKNSWNEKGENVDFSPEKDLVAYTIKNNLFISVNGEEKAITNESNEGIVCGQTVHRNEFGIEKGIFWSPKGSKMAYYRMDETMVTDYPLVNINTRIAELENTKYPMAGTTSHQVTVGVYDVNSEKSIFIKTGEPKEQYLTNISWSPDEKYLFIGVLNRGQDHLKWNMYDVSNGNFIKTLFEEKNNKYVEPQQPFVFVPGTNDKFIYQSQRDGYNHIYLYNTDGKMLKQLTKGDWVVTKLGDFDKKAEKVWIMATKESPLESHAYIVDIKTANISKITTEPGTHKVALTKDFSLFSDSYSSLKMGHSCSIKNSKGKLVKQLIRDENPLKGYDVPEIEFLTLNASDGTKLYGRLFKPVNFDSTKKYPVIVYVYGGPHAQLVTNSWTGGAGLVMYYLASKGYAVFTLDNRGSANRGFEFESAIFRNCGGVEVEDQMAGVDWLKQHKWVDKDRIGVNGWSYGGFMTMSLMLKNPGVFKAAVAGGPVIDWKYYEIMYGERYMDTPAENPEGYKNSALTNYADKLNGRLLIIQGYKDGIVVPQHCLSFLEAAIKAGKVVDFFVYPNHEHNVRGYDAIHLYKTIVQYFDDHLK
mgnify:CR=1 FL=1